MKESLLFLGQAIRNWRTAGTFTQSRPALARAIVDAVGEVADGQVLLELGPGTGVVTRELMHRFPRARVVAVEVLEAFASRLEQEMPEITLVRGCASQLDAHLAGLGIDPDDVAAVVSGLPMLSLPGDLPRRILSSITSVLRPGRRYVQFTYFKRPWRRFTLDGFRRLARRRVWLNLPPAYVLTFVRDGQESPEAACGVAGADTGAAAL
ncbi:MAG TPA: methyltransferase domain-containing protein [Gemmataceae bacterium]|nr:methyltransferase domain-containing protein [Gemmataceae bacterium]